MAKQERVVAENHERIDPIVPMFNYELLTIAGVGAAVGLIVSGAAYALDRYVFQALMCQGEAAGCEEAPTYAMIVAMVIGALLGLVALVQARVYRPLLVVLAATLGLWGFDKLTADISWYWGLLVAVVLFSLSYVLFSWVARVRAFMVAIILSGVVVVAMQLILNN